MGWDVDVDVVGLNGGGGEGSKKSGGGVINAMPIRRLGVVRPDIDELISSSSSSRSLTSSSSFSQRSQVLSTLAGGPVTASSARPVGRISPRRSHEPITISHYFCLIFPPITKRVAGIPERTRNGNFNGRSRYP